MRSYQRSGRYRYALLHIVALFLGTNAYAEDKKINPFDEDVGEEQYLKGIGALVSGPSRHAQKSEDAPAFVSTYTGDQLRAYGFRTLAEAMRTFSGFYLTDGLDYQYIGVRGVSMSEDYNTHLALVVDNVPMNNSMSGGFLADQGMNIDLMDIERIEVTRGPASSMYGSSAFYGVINVTTKHAARSEKSEVLGEYHHLKGRKGFAAFTTPFGEARLRLTGTYFENPEAPYELSFPKLGGKTTKTDYERKYGTAASFSLGNFSLLTLFSYRKQGLPHAPYGTNFGDTGNFFRDYGSVTSARYSHSFTSDLSLQSTAFYSHNRFRDELVYAPSPLWIDRLEGDELGTETRLLWRMTEQNTVIVGGSYGLKFAGALAYELQNGKKAAGLTDIDVQKRYHVGAAYVQDELRILPNVLLTAGLRFDGNTIFSENIAPRVSLNYSPIDGGAFKAFYGQGFRNPTAYEAFYTDGLRYLDNAGLKPEFLHNIETGYEQRVGAFRGFILAYYMLQKNIISQETVGKLEDESEVVRYDNSGTIKGPGAGLGLQYQELRREVFVNTSYQRMRQGGGRLANSPTLLANAGARWWLFEEWQLAPLLHYSDKRLQKDLKGESGRYVLCNLTLSWMPSDGAWEAALSVVNLLNQHYGHVAASNALDNELPAERVTGFARVARRF